MSLARLEDVPSAARRRLLDHYGSAAEPWLAAVPAMLGDVADRWRLRLDGYHDAGCASVLASARADDGRAALIKAWFDRSRYAYEIAALRAWSSRRVPRVFAAADELTIAALDAVGGQPGGAARPADENEAVAVALGELHSTQAPLDAFPRLDNHLWTVVLPRIEARLRTLGGDIPDRCLDAITHLDLDPRYPALLHTDLYQENVLFDSDRQPVFIDPLPMVGDPTYDWAFWVVYYNLLLDPRPRLRTALAVSGVPVEELLPCCLMLCVDGLLYYREAGDTRAGRMADVLAALIDAARSDAPC